MGVWIFDKDAMDFLDNHVHDDDTELRAFIDWLQPDVRLAWGLFSDFGDLFDDSLNFLLPQPGNDYLNFIGINFVDFGNHHTLFNLLLLEVGEI